MLSKLFFFSLLFIHFQSLAQTTPDNYLYNLYQQQGSAALFNKVDSLRNARKANIKFKISKLPATAKSEIKRNADFALTMVWPVLSFSQFNEFKTSGNRVNYENNYFARRNKLNTLVIGELVSGDGKYLPEIVNGLGLLCEESTWALPAHMSLQKAGIGLPDSSEPIIDLFAGNTGMLLGWIKLLLKEELDGYSPLMVERVNAELKHRIFDPYINRDDFWWMGFGTRKRMNNWNIFINTNVLSAALLAEDDPNVRNIIIDKSFRSVDYFLKTYPADGGCDEGPSYWGIAGGALIEYIDLLSYFSQHKLDFSKNELVHNIGAYIYKVHIDNNYFVNFADAGAAVGQDATKIYKYGKLFNDHKLLEFSAYVRKVNNGEQNFDLGNVQGFIGALEIRDEFKDIKAFAPQPKNSWLGDLQVLTARQEEGSANGLFFAAKGGHNGESHNHNDVGNFILYKDGTPVVIDAGVGVYTRQTFSSERYKLWYMQSAWHNCPTINGTMQKQGIDYKASSIKYNVSGTLASLSMDLASAYPTEAGVISWNRNFSFDQKKGSVTISEKYKLSRFKEAATVNFLINGTVALVNSGLLRIRNPQGKTLSLVFNPDEFDYEIETRKIDDARLAVSWHNDLTRLVLRKKGKRLVGKHTILFKD